MLRYELTQADIAAGCQREGSNCPHAIAINRLLKPEYSVCMCRDVIIFEKDVFEWFSDTPKAIAGWIGHYDATGKGEPGWFEIDIPAEYLKTEAA